MYISCLSVQLQHFSDLSNTKLDVDFERKNVKTESDESIKHLCINIYNMLKFTQHVSNIIRKCGFQLNTLWRQSKLLNTKTKLMIFYSFIQANLNYCPLIWINGNRTDMKRFENVKKLTLRIVYNDRISDYSELLNRAKLCTIETRWKRQLVTEVCKAMNDLAPSYISYKFKEKTVH